MNYTNHTYEELRAKARISEVTARIRSGFGAFTRSPVPWLMSILYWLMFLLLPDFLTVWMDLGTLGAKLLQFTFWLAFPLFLVLFLALVALSATPRRAWAITDAFLRTGLVNRAGEAPYIVTTSSKHIEVKTNGIPLIEFKDNVDKLEAGLNVRITRIEEGKDKQHIILRIAPGNTKLPVTLPLTNADIPEGNATLALGVTLDGPFFVDLSKTPHILVGGSTGSGKTYLILVIIQQALYKAFDVYLLDMKGGVDYPRSWKGALCRYNDSRETILETLTALVSELEARKRLFIELEAKTGESCPNIDAYNRLNPDHKLPRVLVVCDEVAEITDTTGLDKPDKAVVNDIVGRLSTLARLGRAFGMHLVLGTQRPDAAVIPGQIKNNIDVRICGRADNVLSTIILDNGAAADLPKTIPGRFICNLDDGTVFQGYDFNI